MIILLLLVGGAIVNVAVAWGCAALSPTASGSRLLDDATPDEVALWRRMDDASGLPKTTPLPRQSFVDMRFQVKWAGQEVVRSRRESAFGYDVRVLSGAVAINDANWPRGNAFYSASARSVLFVRSGWPMLSMSGERWDTGQSASFFRSTIGTEVATLPICGREIRALSIIVPPVLGGPTFRVLPLRPTFPGFIINTLSYALLFGLLFAAPLAARRMIRRRRGLCEKCAYPIGVSPVCTECGAAVRRPEPPETRR